MPKRLKYLWLVEKKIGRWQTAVSYGKKGPMPDENGFLNLNGFNYNIDPKKMRPWQPVLTPSFWQIRKKRLNYMVQIWKENDPTPLDFFHSDPKIPDPRFTAKMISQLSKVKRLELIEGGSQLDWKLLIIVALVIANLAMGFYLAAGGYKP